MNPDTRSWSNNRTLLAGLAVALAVALILIFPSRSPRARFNVMQIIAVGFALTVLIRHGIRRAWKEGTSSSESAVRLPGLALVLGAMAWIPVIGSQFVGDDFPHVYHARGDKLSLLKSLLFEGQDATFMRPLVFGSIFLDHALWGQVAAGYHLTNLLLHAASVLAFYLIQRRLGTSKNAAVLASGIFACLPVQVEAVAWIGARFDLMATAFTLWALVFYLQFRESNRIGPGLAMLTLYLAAMFSKENGFVLPLLVAATEVLFFSTRRFLPVAGLFAAGALAFGYRWYALGGIGGYQSGGAPSAYSIGPKTFEGLFLRTPTLLFTGLNWTQPPAWLVIVMAALLAALLLFLAFRTRPSADTARYIRLGAAWALLPILPAHFLSMVGFDLGNSRIFYMASIGAAMILGNLICAVPGRKARQTAAILLVSVLCLGTFHNVSAWLWTSRVSSEVLREVKRLEPSPQPDVEFVFADMPKVLRGVPLFNVGLTEALRLAYGRDDIVARRTGETPTPGRQPIVLVWKGETGRLIERQGP